MSWSHPGSPKRQFAASFDFHLRIAYGLLKLTGVLSGCLLLVQALKANPERAPRELKVNANYIGRFGQVALTEALDMVYEMAGGREIVITY